MKKLIYITMVLGLVFTSCDPMDDIYAELDAQEDTTIVGDAEYTLTDEDYDALGLSYGNFSSQDDAKAAIPGLLSEMYPVWGEGSSVLVGYDLYIGSAFSSKDYTLDKDDYTFSGSNLLGFESDANPENFLADILASNAGSAREGDYVVAKYSQYSGSAFVVTPTVSLEENLDYGTTPGDLTTISGGNWVNHSGVSNQLAYSTESLTMANYPTSNVGGAIAISSSGSEDVNANLSSIITAGTVYSSALINLSSVSDGTYFFHLMEEDGSFAYSARLGAKSDGAGNVLFGIGATSSSLNYGTTPYALNTTYLVVTSYDIASGTSNLYVLTSPSSYEPSAPEATSSGSSGNSAQRIGIRQGGGGPTAIIDGIRVANSWSAIMSNDDLDDEVIGDKSDYEMVYTYTNGSWEPATDEFYLLTDEDFDSMGTASGQPGRYNNFDSSARPEDYLPTFLDIKFPYAQEGEELDVLYAYYSGGAQLRGNLYTKTDGAWMAYESTISTALQFGHDGTTWVPDNTIKYTLTQADYDSLGTEYGFPGYYNNFDVREGTDNYESPEDILAYLNTVLFNNFPGMAEGQKFTVVYDVYSGTAEVWEMKVILSGGVYVLQ